MAVRISTPATVAESLTLSMITSSDAPLLLLDGELHVLGASQSFGRAFAIDTAAVTGLSIFDLGDGEWNLPKLRSLLTATASGHAAIKAYEIDLTPKGHQPRRLVIKAQKLDYGEADPTRILMTVSDVTDSRLADRTRDDLVRDKALLVQEVQHRVANSLQIIASVLMQSARNVQSEETRTYLNDAHSRVMSIATVQQQLASSHSGKVELRPYFTQLCHSLGASMIRDHERQTIEVNVDDSKVEADVSVSLGLIITELVINALKHAFRDNAAGTIVVDYHAQGPNWTLSVGDNGVGMPTGPVKATAGLGTSIVEALARQLNARVRVSDHRPGTTVSIVHNQIAAVGDAIASEPAV